MRILLAARCVKADWYELCLALMPRHHRNASRRVEPSGGLAAGRPGWRQASGAIGADDATRLRGSRWTSINISQEVSAESCDRWHALTLMTSLDSKIIRRLRLSDPAASKASPVVTTSISIPSSEGRPEPLRKQYTSTNMTARTTLLTLRHGRRRNLQILWRFRCYRECISFLKATRNQSVRPHWYLAVLPSNWRQMSSITTGPTKTSDTIAAEGEDENPLHRY